MGLVNFKWSDVLMAACLPCLYRPLKNDKLNVNKVESIIPKQRETRTPNTPVNTPYTKYADKLEHCATKDYESFNLDINGIRKSPEKDNLNEIYRAQLCLNKKEK